LKLKLHIWYPYTFLALRRYYLYVWVNHKHSVSVSHRDRHIFLMTVSSCLCKYLINLTLFITWSLVCMVLVLLKKRNGLQQYIENKWIPDNSYFNDQPTLHLTKFKCWIHYWLRPWFEIDCSYCNQLLSISTTILVVLVN